MNGDVELVVDGAYRIVRVAEEHRATAAHHLGHPLWLHLPGAEPILSPYLEHARETGDVVESTIFYAGGTVDVTIEPSGAFLAVRMQRRTKLDVSTLKTLATSLRRIEEELAAREPARPDRPARASLQALP